MGICTSTGAHLPFLLSRYVTSPSHQVCKAGSVPLLTLSGLYVSHHTPTLSSSLTGCYKAPLSPGRGGNMFPFLGACSPFLLLALRYIHHFSSHRSCFSHAGMASRAMCWHCFTSLAGLTGWG